MTNKIQVSLHCWPLVKAAYDSIQWLISNESFFMIHNLWVSFQIMIGYYWFSNWCWGSFSYWLASPWAPKRHILCTTFKTPLRGVQKHLYQFQNHCQEYPNYVLLIDRMMAFPTKIFKFLVKKFLLLKMYIPRSSMVLLPRVEAKIIENMPFPGFNV